MSTYECTPATLARVQILSSLFICKVASALSVSVATKLALYYTSRGMNRDEQDEILSSARHLLSLTIFVNAQRESCLLQ